MKIFETVVYCSNCKTIINKLIKTKNKPKTTTCKGCYKRVKLSGV